MARLSLHLRLDNPEHRFNSGAEIRGTVEVSVHEACPAENLVIATGCKGTGAAPRQNIAFLSDTERQTLFSGSWQPGSYSYPFTLTAPDGCTYAGTLMNVAWFVRAGLGTGARTVHRSGSITTSSGFDIEDEKEIMLLPAPVSATDRERMSGAELRRKESARAVKGCLLPSVLMLLGGSIAAWLGLEKQLHYPGMFVALCGLVALWFALRQVLLGRKISSSELRIGSVTIWPGERIPCSLTLQAGAPLEFEQATLILSGWEEVKRFTGMHRTTGPVNKHEVYRNEQSLALPVASLPAGRSVRIKSEFEVPAGSPCTQDFDNEVKLLWRLEISVLIKGSPRWFDIQPIRVLPRIPEDAGGHAPAHSPVV